MAIIKLEIEFEDVIQDMFESDSTDLSAALKSNIIFSTIRKVLPQVKTVIEKQIEERIDGIVKERAETLITRYMEQCFEQELISIGKGGKAMSLAQYVKERFTQDSGWSSPQRFMEDKAKRFGEELKLRYDAVYATQIVAALQKQGLLKPDMDKLLGDANV